MSLVENDLKRKLAEKDENIKSLTKGLTEQCSMEINIVVNLMNL